MTFPAMNPFPDKSAKTLRDEFAMTALSGMLSSCDPDRTWHIGDAAERAYQYADAMLAARKAK